MLTDWNIIRCVKFIDCDTFVFNGHLYDGA